MFFALKSPPVAPDVFVSMDVQYGFDPTKAPGKSYLVWRMGKSPDLVIEVVSNDEGGELTTKKRIYSDLVKVNNYVVWDPEGHLGGDALSVFAMNDGSYRLTPERFFPEIGLGLTIWEGEYGGERMKWLRWTEKDGTLLPIGKEQATRAEQEASAETERQRAETERQRAEADMRNRQQTRCLEGQAA